MRGESGGGSLVVANLAGGARAGGNGVRACEMAERESESEQVGERYAPLAELASGGEGHHRRGEGCWRGDAPPARACLRRSGALSFTRKKTSREQIEPVRT